MNFSKYKYRPEDFKGIQFMFDDLAAFYQALEAYQANKSFVNKLQLKDRAEDVELTLKHRTLNGLLNPALAGEIDSYIGELFYDA